MRQIVLDTETTGLEPHLGHRIIEIGCVELVNRRLTGRHYHQYINPNREIDQGAIEVHGITNEKLADKPFFAAISDEFRAFIDGAQLVIHNAPFDIGFMDHEFGMLKQSTTDSFCSVLDTLVMARQRHPGQKNNLDALCKRYGVDNSQRDLHGALLDAEILADVYLAMTGGQTAMDLGGDGRGAGGQAGGEVSNTKLSRPARLRVLKASSAEVALHQQKLAVVDKASGGACVWLAANDHE